MFSENLKTLRKQKGMSQEILAQQMCVVRQTISKWEKGLSVPDAEMLARLADLFEVSVGDLLGVKIKDDHQTDEVAAQLALLNAYLANRSRRNRKIWKGILIALLAILLLSLILMLVFTRL
jgi:putative transcriptional regulator